MDPTSTATATASPVSDQPAPRTRTPPPGPTSLGRTTTVGQNRLLGSVYPVLSIGRVIAPALGCTRRNEGLRMPASTQRSSPEPVTHHPHQFFPRIEEMLIES